MFYAAGGKHLNSDEFFQAKALAEREARTKELQAKKKLLGASLLLEQHVIAILTAKGNPEEETSKDCTVAELKLLLKWKKVKPTSSKKADLIHAFCNYPSPPNAVPWTAEEELELVALESQDVHMIDTALGVATTQMARAVVQNLPNLDPRNTGSAQESSSGGSWWPTHRDLVGQITTEPCERPSLWHHCHHLWICVKMKTFRNMLVMR
jgi:hypothetical protein